jgi:PST family polysaccharide transporter
LRLSWNVLGDDRFRVKKLLKILSHDWVRDAGALYGVQISRKVLPFVTIPYLIRALGVSGWGEVAFVMSLNELIALLIEFGFNLSATRGIAQNRQNSERLREIVSGVLGSQVLLACLATLAVMLFRSRIPVIHDHASLLRVGLMCGIFQGLNPLWIFQGLERIQLAAGIEIVGKLLIVPAIFLSVHSPAHAWRALAAQGIPVVLSTAVGLTLAFRVVRPRIPTLREVQSSLSGSWQLFLFRSGESLFSLGNAFVLGWFVAPAIVGYFAMAEKLARAAFGLLNPIREALYPRLSRLASVSRTKTVQLAQVGAAVTITGGLVLGASLSIFAPLLIRVLGAGDCEPAVRVLRILSILPPVLAVTHSVGLQWLLPFGRDITVTGVILAAGLLNVVLASRLAPAYAHVGMAWAVVCSELFACICMVVAVASITWRVVPESERTPAIGTLVEVPGTE